MEEIARVFGINWELLLAQSVNFAVLLLALWYFLYRPVMRMIDARREKIEEGVQNAEAAERRLEEIEGEREEIVSSATREADEIVAASKERAQQQANSIVTDAATRAESVMEAASQQAEEAKAAALRESQDEIAKTSLLAAEKILREKASTK